MKLTVAMEIHMFNTVIPKRKVVLKVHGLIVASTSGCRFFGGEKKLPEGLFLNSN